MDGVPSIVLSRMSSLWANSCSMTSRPRRGLAASRRADAQLIITGPAPSWASPSTGPGEPSTTPAHRPPVGVGARRRIAPRRTTIVPTPSYQDSSRPSTSRAAWAGHHRADLVGHRDAVGRLPALGPQRAGRRCSPRRPRSILVQHGPLRRAARTGSSRQSAGRPGRSRRNSDRSIAGRVTPFARRWPRRAVLSAERGVRSVAWRSATARASSMIARPARRSSSPIVIGGTTWVRLKCVNGHRPRCLQAAANSFIGAAAGPAALNGTSGSRVSSSLHQLDGPEHAEAADLADAGVARGDLGQRRPDDVGAEVAGVLDDALLLEDVDAGHGRGAGQRVAGVRQPAGIRALRRTCRRCARLMTTPPSGT